MLLDLLFPKACLSCSQHGAYICPNCLTKISRHNQTCIVCYHPSPFGKTHPECQKHTPLNGAILATEYKELSRTTLHSIKYRLNYAILTEFLDKTLKSLKIQACLEEHHFDFCTEIPMHWYKQNQRGFNQAQLITKWIEKTYHIKHQTILEKTKATTAQMHLKREERIFNVQNVFSLRPNSDIMGKNILLVDDVTTTASTLEECAKILKTAHADSVWAIVIASRR